MNYYNEIDPFAVGWLHRLIQAGELPDGVVDTRPIQEVTAHDLTGFSQCHFFAGIGGWPLALRLAGWPDDRPVWSGSCPCQPFSRAGQQRGTDDNRHLWPYWHTIIDKCRPSVVFGEQVAGKAGRAWIDLVSPQMEASGYAFGCADLSASSVGAPHIRQRHFFVGLGHGVGARLERHPEHDHNDRCRAATHRPVTTSSGDLFNVGPVGGHWSSSDWLPGTDGQYRPVEPGAYPMDYGIPDRMGRLRGYGNAIVPQVAAAFIEAVMDLDQMKI